MAIARLDGLGWSGPLRDLFSISRIDGELPTNLRHACAQLLTSWQNDLHRGTASLNESDTPRTSEGATDTKPVWDGVIGIMSSTRPQLTSHLTEGLARYLTIPVLGTIHPKPGFEQPSRHDVNSATRLAAVSHRLELGLIYPLAGKKILLVDDYTDSGWTLTVSARLILEAGASQVYPMCLAQQ